jgi:hypothetical protein
MNLNDAMTCLWLTKSHWANFAVLTGEQQALQAGAWLDVLGDIDLPDVRVALAQIDAEGREFPPTPGQVREAVLASRGAIAPDWDEAYTAVNGSIRKYGSCRGPGWAEPWQRPELHPAVEEAVKGMGGWYDVGQAHVTDAWRAQFRDVYLLAKARFDREAKTPPAVREISASLAKALALPSPEAS